MQHKNKKERSAIETIITVAGVCRGMAGRSTPAITEEDQGSSNYSGRTGVTQDYGIVTQQQQQPSISSAADHHLGYNVHGGGAGGAGALDFVPGENFWAIDDFWTTMQSYQGGT
jgi:myb proto-oncogene protein